ncbi:metal-sensing transcriptional repressor [Arcobacter porcinus]|uniref:Copper-sensing transcriptional repressor CsoR n=1 Tax=Arcobacter porcinus TaxID=1935204 RepID=A0A1C0B1D2_9BACT|nr:metal-sensing transcriptional repressor [Arcobacter porcinus]OCL89902.1 Copper-sensing transcriptional repressor CsoR [Aliarcobacter thereius]OCL83022.1 Copper-sensing transcriptional repressor CsoR [Arcobacter porcinus]OCL84350.1 Copper-sensing transcriptional repressor CsoR [Arcobacter porcinus]OCL88890.1 Copper-sensing transcriptional repressor CsoR [Arcobacter porcinus]OCL93668.1 Copper-sensing transcriptional repressor CsoR [Arcobacter porcinus]
MNEEKKKALQTLKIAKGQIEAVIKMIEDGRYCIDISNQILAVSSLVKKSNMLILKQHMNSCVLEAVNSGNSAEKIDEITKILSKIVDK